MKKALSILLAVVFFISSTGFTISSHKCGGKIHKQSLDFIAEDLSCGMETSEDRPCEDNALEDNCCQNEFQKIKITDTYQKVTTDNDNQFDNDFLFAFSFAYIQLFNVKSTTYNKYLNYTPPLPDQDIPVLFQSFLI